MNCRDFTSEFEERKNALSEIAARHLNDCADCRKSSSVQARVWQAIEAFEKVDAPKDFDFRVKARIANAKPRDFHPQFFPVLRYVLGASVVGLVLAFVIFNGFYSLDEKNVPAVAETNLQSPIQKANPIIKTPNIKQVEEADVLQPLPDKNLIARVSSKPKIEPNEKGKQLRTAEDEGRFIAVKSVKIPQAKAAVNNQENSGGSHDLTSRDNSPVITPKGINLSETSKTLPNDEKVNSMTAEQILSFLGIETSLVNGTRQVKTLKQNSVGERSDVKVGDFVEAIDGEKLTGEPIHAKTFEGKSLTIRRGAETIEILLHN